MKKVLIIAYHYPPVGASSGVHRTLKFSQYLSQYGWEPLVLTINPKAYTRLSDQQLKDIPADMVVKRSFGLDTAQQLSIKGRYISWMALPDRWASWSLGGVWSGLGMIRRYKPDIIWSTYPIATAHLIAYTLHKISGLPWIADFRDSMTEEDYPHDKRQWKMYRWIEKQALQHARFSVFTTPSTVTMYKERYPDVPAEKLIELPNGYDEENFSNIEQSLEDTQGTTPKKITLLHSGLLYRSERDPRDFFQALKELKVDGHISHDSLSIILRASGDEDYYRDILKELELDQIVTLAPPMGYIDALKEMYTVSGLLLFQASNCNHQIPAKAYEYMRCGKPVFAMTDTSGDTAATLRRVGINSIVPLNNTCAIKQGLLTFLRNIENGDDLGPAADKIAGFSRQSLTGDLARLLEAAVNDKP